MIPPIARRFVAGETAADAAAHAAELDEHDVGAIFNLLGEHYSDPAPARVDARAYCDLLTQLDATDARTCISVKPTQLGLDVGEECFRDNLATVMTAAREQDTFVWLDMEGQETIDATLDAYEHYAREYGDVGVCLQANMRRTMDDLERVSDLPGKIRLVKGAYDPPASVAYQDTARVNEEMRRCLEYMFETFESGIAVGSHDPAFITLAAELHDEYGTPYELQMLMGVRTDAQYDLAEHHDVWQYIPYGSKWASYFYRRVTERTENLTFALRALNPFQ